MHPSQPPSTSVPYAGKRTLQLLLICSLLPGWLGVCAFVLQKSGLHRYFYPMWQPMPPYELSVQGVSGRYHARVHIGEILTIQLRPQEPLYEPLDLRVLLYKNGTETDWPVQFEADGAGGFRLMAPTYDLPSLGAGSPCLTLLVRRVSTLPWADPNSCSDVHECQKISLHLDILKIP